MVEVGFEFRSVDFKVCIFFRDILVEFLVFVCFVERVLILVAIRGYRGLRFRLWGRCSFFLVECLWAFGFFSL